MQEKLYQRLQTLKAEYKSGQQVLDELETKQANLRTTLLRISGAIQVLEEMLAEVQPEPATPGVDQTELLSSLATANTGS